MSDEDEKKRIGQDIMFKMWQGMTDRQFKTQVFSEQAQAVIPDVMKRLFGDEDMVKDIKRYCEIILEANRWLQMVCSQ